MGKGKRGRLDNLFRNVVKWSDKIIPQHKVVWVKCWGLPLSMWNKQVFGKVLEAQTLEMVTIDEATLLFEEIEYARIKVRNQFIEQCIQWL